MEQIHRQEEKVNGKPVVFMCYMGQERSYAIQKIYEDAGKRVDIFDGGTRRLCWMNVGDIKRELGKKFVYLIYDQGSSGLEYQVKQRAVDLLEQAGVSYNPIDTIRLQIMARNLGGNLDNYLL